MRTLKGLAALLALTALVVGIPAALILLVGNPIPSTAELQQAMTGIDFGGTFLMGTVLPLIAWGFWASFIYSLVVEVISLIRRVETPNLGGALRPQQALAGALIAAVLALGGGSPAFALTPQDTASAPAAVAMAQEGQTTQDTPAAAGERTYTVQEGDTLWGIARDELGQGSRWGELAEQMRSTPQADGQTLTDPDLIMTGWTVELPDGPTGAGSTSATPSPSQPAPAPAQTGTDAQPVPAPAAPSQPAEQPAEQPAPAPAAPSASASAEPSAPADDSATPAPEAAAAPSAASDSTPAQDAQHPLPGEAVSAAPSTAPAEQEGPSAVPGGAFTQTAPAPADLSSHQEQAAPEEVPAWATIGGIGAFAAAGLLGIVGLRRQLQRRRRQPGQSVPMPEEQTAQLETQLRVVAEPEQAEELDVVQRWLARWAHENGQDLPELFLVRVSPEQIALYLMAPAQLPEPFVAETDDGVVWTLASGSIDIDPDLPAAPYPSLVTVGQDDTRSQVLLDLERLGTLGIDGDPQLTTQVLDAMAVELATSSWSENVTITLVGVADGLAKVVSDGRVRQIDDLDQLIGQLDGKAKDIRRALDEQDAATLDQARAANQEEAFGPEIVLLGLEPTPAQARRLTDLAGAIPRLGIAAVTTANPLASDWILNLEDEDHADLLPVNQHLRPQKITPEEGERIKELLATALEDPRSTGRGTTATIDINTVLDERPHLSAVADLEEMLHEEENTQDLPLTPAPAVPAAETAEDETDPAEENEEDVLAAQTARHTPTPAPAPHDTMDEDEDEESQDQAAAAAVPTEPEDITPEPQDQTPAVVAVTETAGPAEPEPEPEPAATAEPAQQEAATDLHDTSPAEDEDEDEKDAAPEQLASTDPQKQIDLDAAHLLEQATTQAPMILMLGELKLVGAQGQAPVTAATGEVSTTQTARCVALAAYLALHPGASAEAVHAAFWPTQRSDGKSASSNRNKLTGQTRRLLGQAADGTPYLPAVGSEGYRVHEDVLTDWQVVQSLIGDDPVKASTPALVAAMRLVRGVPFEHAKASNVAWAEALVQEMVQTICDAAHELVARSLAAGHREHAQLAARVGRAIDPANEAAWRDALVTEAAAGNHTEVTRLIEKLYSYLESFEEDLEPEVETTALIEELRAHGYRVA
ncbi:hypothetical protein O3783_08240 [Micrococcus luteus]|uniref:hypothetical protein n=1 Tax=Micrococcus luteus TaxID=1270 RepID=UPI00352DA3D7